jgi:hypothetical protein
VLEGNAILTGHLLIDVEVIGIERRRVQLTGTRVDRTPRAAGSLGGQRRRTLETQVEIESANSSRWAALHRHVENATVDIAVSEMVDAGFGDADTRHGRMSLADVSQVEIHRDRHIRSA